jgi:hypothetical protein
MITRNKMREIIANTFMTLDGVMQAPGGPEEDPTGGFKYGGSRNWKSLIHALNIQQRGEHPCNPN